MKKGKRGILLLLLFCLTFCSPDTVQAKTVKKGWVESKNGNFYYYKNGKKAKGFIQIDGQKYYFDEKGIQRKGWRKIGKNYYFFRISDGKGGYCVKSKEVNGIRLGANGRAVKLTSYSKRKLALMVKANKLVDKITNNKMTKREKLWAAFKKTKKLKDMNWGGFKKSENWDIYYAERAFETKRADCYGCAAYFAYLANAVGYEVKTVSSGYHGWAEIGGKIYDAAFSRAYRNYSYFGNSYSLSGKNGFPCYKGAGRYFKTI